MRLLYLLIIVFMFSIRFPAFSSAQDDYPPHPDSQRKPGTPEGKIEGPMTWRSRIFPGTVRDYWIYVPSQYDDSKPACVLVVQDGLGRAKGWKLPVVMDNLIHEKAMPVTIGIFVSPGVVPAQSPHAEARYNRSFEYDGLGDRYARFLLEELLPAVAKDYRLSDDPNDRAIAGASSGGICAFTAAWERPDAFRRVLSTIGTFVSLRGGNEYPSLIRKFEPKPIRVFLQDGNKDLNIYGGDWWQANLTMLSALKFAGYDVEHRWGEGGHNSKHAAAIMPDALRWLWRDYPEPIVAKPTPQRRTNILIPGEEWKLVAKTQGDALGLAVNAEGVVYVSDAGGSIHRLSAEPELFASTQGGVAGISFGSDGRLYACHTNESAIHAYDAQGKSEVILPGATATDLIMLPDHGYALDGTRGKVWLFTSSGRRRLVDAAARGAGGLTVSPDKSLLQVSDFDGRFGFSHQIQADGGLDWKQRFSHFHVPDAFRASGAAGMASDIDGRTYAATFMGIQVIDPLGRVHLILNAPGKARLGDIVFGGPERDRLFVTCGDAVFARRLKTRGAISWEPGTKPPKPRL